ncbi:phosphonoacetaldehyde reductase [Clostridiaceae bacterium 35-E11]
MGNYYNPVKMHFGVDQIKNLSSILEEIEDKTDKILLLTRGADFDESMSEKIILEGLASREVEKYAIPLSNPDITDLYNIKQATDTFAYDFIIAIGGGSVIDIGKAMAALRGIHLNSYEDIRQIMKERIYISHKTRCGFMAIPTTAGTGSEVTFCATLWDKEKESKYTMSDKMMYPDIAIIDPKLTVSMPIELTVSTGLDAICHATEAYWSRNTNALSRIYALHGIKNIMENIEKLIEDLENIELRTKIAYGSLYGGLAFSNTKLTSCHSISYPMTAIFDIPHGIAASITLGKMLILNEKALKEKEKLLTAFGVKKVYEVDEVIGSIYEKAGIPYRLKEYGIKKADLKQIANQSFIKRRMENNPVNITREILMNILYSVY